MDHRFEIDGVEYSTMDLSDDGKELVSRLAYTRLTLIEMKNRMALLAKAKNGYIEDMKTEIIQGRAGFDFSDLFSDEQ